MPLIVGFPAGAGVGGFLCFREDGAVLLWWEGLRVVWVPEDPGVEVLVDFEVAGLLRGAAQDFLAAAGECGGAVREEILVFS